MKGTVTGNFVIVLKLVRYFAFHLKSKVGLEKRYFQRKRLKNEGHIRHDCCV